MWACPKCKRRFTRKNQRHVCGTGCKADVLRDRPKSVTALYDALESFAKTLGPVELVTRDRYVLLRSDRIFADAVVMSDPLRLAIHLSREVASPLFIKIVADKRHVTHVAKLRTLQQLTSIEPLLREAYEYSLRSKPAI